MIKNIFKKIAIIYLLFILFEFNYINPITGLNIEHRCSNITRINQFNKNYNIINLARIDNHKSNNNSNPLKIVKITDGNGITIELKNIADFDISNISLNIKKTAKFVKILSNDSIKIPVIHLNESIKIKINFFGFKLGEPIDYNRIIIRINGTNFKSIKRIIVLNIIGYYTFIKAIYSNDQGSHDGYILYGPEYSYYTFLINNQGDILHSWKSDYLNCITVHLLENGNLLRSSFLGINPQYIAGGITGVIEMFDWNGSLLWKFKNSNKQYCLHHDIEPLPNGNILMIAWECKNYSECIAAGRNPSKYMGEIWPCCIIEVQPTGSFSGNIVWEWHVWDHLIQDFDSSKDNFGIVEDHPELLDINYATFLFLPDWNHLNSLDYNVEFDQILISSHNQNEIWVIDHSTTVTEASGHSGGRYGKGGDILYRWGNPQAYQKGNDSDQMFFGQHDARWIKKGLHGEGNIIIFNNGFLRPGQSYSSAIEIVPPIDEAGNYFYNFGSNYAPEKPFWVYTANIPTDFYAPIQSGVQRLPNGNTLICDGPGGRFFEVTPEKDIVWEYVNLFTSLIDNRVDKMQYYPIDFPGIKDFNANLNIFPIC